MDNNQTYQREPYTEYIECCRSSKTVQYCFGSLALSNSKAAYDH